MEAEADEMHSVVKNKANEQCLWLAMDRPTRQMIALHIGERSRTSAKQLWANLPAVYREQDTFSTDQDVVYQGVIPAAWQKAMTKNARKTNHIERFNTTLRPRVSRWVRQPLAFSKNVANHIGAMRYCICHDHLTSAAA